MLLRSIALLAALTSTPVFAQAITWTNHNAGQPVPVHAIVGGVEAGRPVPLCRGKSQGAWVPGKLIGQRCVIIENRAATPRRKAIQVALPGPSAHLLVWSSSPKATPLRADSGTKRRQAFCRGNHGGVLLLGRHIDGRCTGVSRGRPRRIRTFEVLATSAAKLPILKQANIGGDPLHEANAFWSEKLRQANAAISPIESASGFGLRPLLGSLRRSAGLSTATVAAAFGKPIWRSGPHGQARAKLNHKKSFGHYNPEFVRWLTTSVPTPKENPVAFKLASRVYKRSMALIARTWYAVGLKIKREPACKRLLRQQHRMHVRRGSTAWRSFELMMHPRFCHNPRQARPTTWRRDLVGQAAAWWARRHADGTAGLWMQFFNRSMKTFDGAFAAKPQAPMLP